MRNAMFTMADTDNETVRTRSYVGLEIWVLHPFITKTDREH